MKLKMIFSIVFVLFSPLFSQKWNIGWDDGISIQYNINELYIIGVSGSGTIISTDEYLINLSKSDSIQGDISKKVDRFSTKAKLFRQLFAANQYNLYGFIGLGYQYEWQENYFSNDIEPDPLNQPLDKSFNFIESNIYTLDIGIDFTKTIFKKFKIGTRMCVVGDGRFVDYNVNNTHRSSESFFLSFADLSLNNMFKLWVTF